MYTDLMCLDERFFTAKPRAEQLTLTATPPCPLLVVAGRLGDDPKALLGTYAHLLAHSDAMAAKQTFR